jgi:hypothetical protein
MPWGLWEVGRPGGSSSASMGLGCLSIPLMGEMEEAHDFPGALLCGVLAKVGCGSCVQECVCVCVCVCFIFEPENPGSYACAWACHV